MKKLTIDFQNDTVFANGVQVPCNRYLVEVRPKICALLGVQDDDEGIDELCALIAARWTGKLSSEEFRAGLASLEV